MSLDLPIYLDNNATTPCDPRVVEKMLPFFSEWYGNPSNGLHIQGRRAAREVEEARAHVAALIGAQPGEIIFTSGATESNNLAIFGLARAMRGGHRNRIVTSAVEHKSVLGPFNQLANEGFDVVILPVDNKGRVETETARTSINEDTLLVSIQAANNEIGTLQPFCAVAAIAHQAGAIIHCDAAQAIGKIPWSVWNGEAGADLLSMSAHKLYGPKGIGALFIRGGRQALPLQPLCFGGGQESALRPGTSNVAAIVGLGEACRVCKVELAAESGRIQDLRDRFESMLQSAIPGLQINGLAVDRLPNTSSIVFPDAEADALLLNLPEVMMGTGSACTSGALEPSHVLTAIGISRENSASTVRASLGRFTTEVDIDQSSRLIVDAWRELSS